MILISKLTHNFESILTKLKAGQSRVVGLYDIILIQHHIICITVYLNNIHMYDTVLCERADLTHPECLIVGFRT